MSSDHRFSSLDEFIIRSICEWRAARAKQEIEWAKRNLANAFGHKPDRHLPTIDLTALDEMYKREQLLAESKPESVLAAVELLHVAVEIMAYAHVDPEHVFAGGPALE